MSEDRPGSEHRVYTKLTVERKKQQKKKKPKTLTSHNAARETAAGQEEYCGLHCGLLPSL